VVEHFTHDPKIGVLNPATGSSREKMVKGVYEIWMEVRGATSGGS
jgi:hypothetical protein